MPTCANIQAYSTGMKIWRVSDKKKLELIQDAPFGAIFSVSTAMVCR
ncbi:MAG: hypothetical protein ABSC05_13250 [Candidatus Solibacter sp.]|jgi:hypothetical protein